MIAGARLINQDISTSSTMAKKMTALNFFRFTPHHIIAQIIEPNSLLVP
jgi:hypothetical protein